MEEHVKWRKGKGSAAVPGVADGEDGHGKGSVDAADGADKGNRAMDCIYKRVLESLDVGCSGPAELLEE